MALFGGKKNKGGAAPAATPVAVTADDRVTCARIIGELETAMMLGNDAGVRTAARSLATAAGVDWDTGDMQQVMRVYMKDSQAMHRPWRWLDAVSRDALENGDAVLAARVGYFVKHWAENVAPGMTINDEGDTGLPKAIDSAIVSGVTDRARRALGGLPPEAPVVVVGETQISAGVLLEQVFSPSV